MAKLKFRAGGETAALPLAAALLEPEFSELDMRIILQLAAKGELDDGDLDALAASVGCPRSEVDLAVSYLRGAGVIAGRAARRTAAAVPTEQPEAPAAPAAPVAPVAPVAPDADTKKKLAPSPSMPVYTAAEVDRIFEAHEELRALLELCQNTLGRVFNSAESNTILGLRDYLCLDEAYILTLLTYCAGKDKRSLRYIEKMAFTLHDKGIDTPEALEEYLRKKERLDSEEGRLRRLFGMGSRALTAKEKVAFGRWCGEWRLPFELIERAYETTVNAIREPSVPYADKILEKWHAAGYKSAAEVEAALQSGKNAGGAAGSSFDTDDFFEAALRRSYGKNPTGENEK